MWRLLILWSTLMNGVRGINQETSTIKPQFSKLTSHIAIKEILDYRVYEASVPLIYESKWSKPEDIQVNYPCQKENQWCKAAEQLQQFHKIIEADFININNDLKYNTEEISTRTIRQKRSVIATFLGYCCGVASKEETQDLYVGESKLAYNLQSLYKTVDTEHSQLSQVATSVETMTVQANQFLKMTKETIADTINKTENISQNENIMFSMVMKNTVGIFQSIEAQRKSRIIDICKENKIPHIVVPLETLRSDLKELDEKISPEGYTLSIQTKDITAYYSAEIATCMFSPSKIAIKIQVPIIKKNTKYSISKLIPIPFAWKNSTCVAQHQEEELWISSEHGQVSKVNKEDCKKGLCFIRRVRTQTPSEATCIQLIMRRKNHKLMELCEIKCYHSAKTTVTQIKEDHLILTHPSNETEIICPGTKKILSENITYGALEVWLPCNCQIRDKKTIIVENTFPCDSRITDSLQISHIIPQQWTKWATTPEKINLIIPMSKNITDLISANWTFTNPHFQIHKEIDRLPFSLQEMMTSNSHIIAIIITSTTSSIFVLLCITLYLRKHGCMKRKRTLKSTPTIIVTGEQGRTTMRSIQDLEMDHIMKLQ